MALTRESSKYTNTSVPLHFPSVSIDGKLAVLGESVFNGNVQINGTLKTITSTTVDPVTTVFLLMGA
jgi:hypothetical protein